MNAINLTTNPASDYRAAMQQAAVAYLYRHRCEHLAGDSQLLGNCVRYLTLSLEVPQHLVQRIAELAVAEFESMTCKRVAWLGFIPTAARTAHSSGYSTTAPNSDTSFQRACFPHACC